MKRYIRVLIIFITVAFASAALSFGCGGGEKSIPTDITVSAVIVLADGTEKELSSTPLPLNLNVQITFSAPVDTALAEALFSIMAGNSAVPTINTWNADNTVMTAKPRNTLNYQTTYTITIDAGAVTADVSADYGKADVTAFSETFTTMVNGDVNGDGLADVTVPARGWNAGDNTGRTYLFYGNGMTSEPAASADAIITGEGALDMMVNIWSSIINFDLNDDGYAEVFNFGILYPSGTARGRYYIFYGGAGDAPISGALDAANADVVLTGDADGDTFNAPYIGDVNGDGYSDLVGRATGSITSPGHAYIFFGPTFTSGTASDADVIFTGENASDGFSSLIRLGDINGDGVDDFVISAPNYNSGDLTGRIYVFYGGSSLANTGAASADVIITGENAGDIFRLRELGDINGDGVLDIVASSDQYDAQRGRAYVFYGGSLGNANASTADIILDGETGQVGFGGLIYLGDVTGDGVNDIIVNASTYDTNRGRIYGFAGGSSLSSKNASEADFIFTGENQNDWFNCFALGDVNGDGIDDIIGNASSYPNSNWQGRAYVFFGGSAISSRGAGSADVIITGENNNDSFGTIRVQDVNGDGVKDIFCGAGGYNAGGATGRGYLFYGGSSIASSGASLAPVIIDGENVGDTFGL